MKGIFQSLGIAAIITTFVISIWAILDLLTMGEVKVTISMIGASLCTGFMTSLHYTARKS